MYLLGLVLCNTLLPMLSYIVSLTFPEKLKPPKVVFVFFVIFTKLVQYARVTSLQMTH